MVPSPNSRSSHTFRALRAVELPREFEFELVRILAFATGSAAFAEGSPTLRNCVVEVEREYIQIGIPVEHYIVHFVHVYLVSFSVVVYFHLINHVDD